MQLMTRKNARQLHNHTTLPKSTAYHDEYSMNKREERLSEIPHGCVHQTRRSMRVQTGERVHFNGFGLHEDNHCNPLTAVVIQHLNGFVRDVD